MANPTTYPSDGRLTTLQNFPGAISGSELMEIVSPGNPALGINYNITLAQLAFYFVAGGTNVINLTTGATLGTPYNVSTTANIVLFNKGAASPSYAVLPLANTMSSLNPVLFKDRNGDAFTDNITISFSGGEACDGSSTVVLNNAYAWARIAPYPGGGGWYQC